MSSRYCALPLQERAGLESAFANQTPHDDDMTPALWRGARSSQTVWGLM